MPVTPPEDADTAIQRRVNARRRVRILVGVLNFIDITTRLFFLKGS
jgi:hypothetical protein